MTNARSHQVGNISYLIKSILFTLENKYFFNKRYILHITYLGRSQTWVEIVNIFQMLVIWRKGPL